MDMRWTFTGAGTGATYSGENRADFVLPTIDGFQTLHAYVNGTFGAGGAVQIEYSPDLPGLADGSSRWFAPTVLLFTASGDTFVQIRARKIRAVYTGGDGTTNVTVEML